jgi:predicted phage-related endonuclease
VAEVALELANSPSIYKGRVNMNRIGFIGGSDAMRIMKGGWFDLYQEKIGAKQPEDLSNVFKVQLGLWSEHLHADWFSKTQQVKVATYDGMRRHKDHDWMGANLDRWLPELNTFLEMKHSSNGVTARDKARYYMPQLQHYMAVTNTDYCYFSVIRGNDEPEVCRVDHDHDYIQDLIKMENAFWWHVINKEVPDLTPVEPALEAAAKKIETIKVDGMRIMDMSSNNLWAELSGKIIENAEAAKIYDDSKEALRKLIEDDWSEAYGHGITAKRDKRGRVIIRPSKEK